MEFESIILQLRELGDPTNVAGMRRYGITSNRAYGVRVPELRRIAKDAGRNHALATQLWSHNARETRLLAGMIAEPAAVTTDLMERWVVEFDNWEVCDQACMNLFEKTPHARTKALEWSARQEEYVKRAGFVLMARLAVSDKSLPDESFVAFLPIIGSQADDPRKMVMKGVNWALRQIGKRNLALNERALAAGRSIRKLESKSARWIASDAIRELTSEAVRARLQRRAERA